MKTPKIKITNKISDKGYPISNSCYKQAHRQANQKEIQKYGKRQFNKLNSIIKTLIPKGELDGKHTITRTIQISKKVPKEYRNQVKFHELIELDEMKNC